MFYQIGENVYAKEINIITNMFSIITFGSRNSSKITYHTAVFIISDWVFESNVKYVLKYFKHSFS